MTAPDSTVDRLFRPTHKKRVLFFALADTLLFCCSLFLAFGVRFDFDMPQYYGMIVQRELPLFIGIKLLVFGMFGVYRMAWRHVGIHDLFNLMIAMGTAQLLLVVAILVPMGDIVPLLGILHVPGFPRSVFVIDFLISGILIATLRLGKRLYLEAFRQKTRARGGRRAIIIGGGITGEALLRDFTRNPKAVYDPVCILDDDPLRKGQYLHGVPVHGAISDLESSIRGFRAETVIIAHQSLEHKTLRSIYEQAKAAGITDIKTVPPVADYDKPLVSLKDLEEISIEDLIGRQAVQVDHQEIRGFLTGKAICITGAGGSIGSEIVRQVCGFEPESLLLFDIDETELHRMQRKLADFPFPIHFVAGDVCDERSVDEAFSRFRPEIVFHAAAYKHVPMMEMNPKEALKVNILGTATAARTACRYRASTFIMISTDKAVRPTSIMGASKRLAEDICRSLNSADGTQFISVRFGNVLGSRGSVLPIFMEQLKHGGPLTITHKDMRRYFMTIPEAVSLVLQASATGSGGDVMVLDMGEPVSIVSLAEELIRIHGLEPYRDIDIVFTGVRPGEKLFEEMLTAEEGTTASKRNKIFFARNRNILNETSTTELIAACEQIIATRYPSMDEERSAVRKFLKNHVAHYCEAES